MQNQMDPSFFCTSTTALHQGDWLDQLAPASSTSLSDAQTSSSKGGGMHLKCSLERFIIIQVDFMFNGTGTFKLIRLECKDVMVGEE